MKKLACCLLLLTIIKFCQSQDPEFSQFYSNPLYTNPALAGTHDLCGGRIILNARNQWSNLARPYETFSASFDKQLDKISGGFGVLVTNDVQGQGLLTTQSLSAIYSNLIHLNRDWNLRTGIQATFTQKSIDFSKLNFSDQIDPRRGFFYNTQEPLPAQSIVFPNFSSGFLLYSSKSFVGFSIHNLIEPNQSFYRSASPGSNIPRRFTINTGMNFKLDKQITVSPRLLMMVQKQFSQINVGCNISNNFFAGGLYWRQTRMNKDALIVLAGFKIMDFKFNYSYDFTVSNLKIAAPGSHEISLLFDLPCRSKKPNTTVVCPFSSF